MVEPVSDNILNLVNELYNNLDAKDKIINERALEIANLNKRLENEQKVAEEYLKLEDDYELLYNDLDNANSKLSDLMKLHLKVIDYCKSKIKEQKELPDYSKYYMENYDKAINLTKSTHSGVMLETIKSTTIKRYEDILEILGDK